jgi:2-hydroxy-3-keto-5-methylthiopentenyl-1-phosphate phosphatase
MWTVLADFDGTIVEKDLAEAVLDRFADPDWKRFNRLLDEGLIGVEECVRSEYAMIRARRQSEITLYARRLSTLRPGFRNLLCLCKIKSLEFAVVSAGLDFCIEDTFRTRSIPLPRLICPESSFAPLHGIGVEFPDRKIEASRDFKEDSVLSYKRRGYRVIYVGDGTGDFHAAERADVLSTVRSSSLDKICAAKEIPHIAIRTFNEMTRYVEKQLQS